MLQAIPVHLQCLCCTVFTARCYASAVLAMGLCLSVSVTSRSSTKTAERRITQTTPHDTPGTSAKFDRGHPLRGRQMQVGWAKIVDFRQITGYISKTVQDRHIVSIKVEYTVRIKGAIWHQIRCQIVVP